MSSVKSNTSKEKEEAVAFYSTHKVTEAIETLLNTMFRDKPEDVFGYMSEYFHRLSLKPVVSGIKGCYQLDGRGSQCLCLTMYCKINGVDKVVCTYTHPIPIKRETQQDSKELLNNVQQPKGGGQAGKTKQGSTSAAPPNASGGKPSASVITAASTSASMEGGGDGAEEEQQEPALDPLESLKYFEEKLRGISPVDQITTADNIIDQLSATQSNGILNGSTQAALSCLMAVASSKLTDSSSFVNLLKTFDEPISKLSTPIPIMAVICGGQEGIGKLKMRSFLLSPSPTMDITEGSKHVISVYKEIGRQLSMKQGVSGSATLPNGTYLMAADKPEQVLELLREATTQAGLELNREILLYIDIGADGLYDSDKKKYEITTGQWKTSDELVTMYSTLLSSYPGLTGFIDPLHPKDQDGWMSLTEQLGNKCLLMADKACSELFATEGQDECRPEGSGSEEGEPTKTSEPCINDKKISFITCATLPVSNSSLLSDYFKEAIKLKGFCNYTMLSLNDNQTIDSLKFAMELGIALRCKFIRMSAPVGLGSLVALTRLGELQAELKCQGVHRPSSALLFSCVKN